MNPNTEIMKHFTLVTELGLTMIGSIGVGFGFGYYIDLKINKFPVCTIVGLLLGIASGFWTVYKIVMKKLK